MPWRHCFFIKIALKLSHICKKIQNFWALGALPLDPRASGSWGFCPQTPSLLRLGAPPPDPQNSPPLRISGYAPGYLTTFSKNPDTKNKSSFGAGLKRVFTAIWNGFTRSTWQRQTMNSRPKESGDAVCTPPQGKCDVNRNPHLALRRPGPWFASWVSMRSVYDYLLAVILCSKFSDKLISR